ncbi:MAG TPA: helix-turn-helix domain-containing protein [Bryobacteraceae bacterium]|nr:helix-turn-helix domain-containing protein [Bryobacteraceae bacterium]
MLFLCPCVTRFFQRWQQHADPRDIVAHFPVSLRTVQRLFARFEQRGDDGIAPDYHQCGQQQAQQTAPSLVEHLCQTRRDHPRWGAEMIRLELEDHYDTLPCARTVQRHLGHAGLQPAPAGRTPSAVYPRVPRAERPHQGWQMDASENLRLKGHQRACWLRIVDECSGAFLKTWVFAAARWEHVDRHQIQEALRGVFACWGLPDRFRVDNGYPWGSTGEFPPEMALWLIGLGIEMVWIPPACPQQNGVVERAQGTGQNWAEPPTCRDAAELQQRCDDLDRRQRERYPYRDGQSRWEVYPALTQARRPYRRRREPSAWDVAKVLAVVAQQVVKRQVDCTGSVSVYHRTRYVGKPYIGKAVYVSLDPSGPTWVFADEAGTELRTHAADELTANRIRSLTVGCRKGKQS